MKIFFFYRVTHIFRLIFVAPQKRKVESKMELEPSFLFTILERKNVGKFYLRVTKPFIKSKLIGIPVR